MATAEKTATAPRWTRLDRDERSEQILACARRLFHERSYSAVSMAEIADAAGVTRGLLNHYFGNKRDLYLAVVSEMVRVPPPPLPADIAGRGVEEVLAESIDRWLEMVWRNRRTWLAAIGAEGFGSDPEVEEILEDAREEAALRVLRILGLDDSDPTPEMRAVVRAYGAMAEGATQEWLRRKRLTREQVHTLLVKTVLAMVGEVLPSLVMSDERSA